MIKYFFSILFLAFIYFPCFSQPQFNNYTTVNTGNNGLVCNWINSIGQQSNGTMWFSTEMGVCNYDGINWNDYTKILGMDTSSNQTYFPYLWTTDKYLCTDLNDNVWILDIQKDVLIKYDMTSAAYFPLPQYWSGVYDFMCDSQNRIWIIPNNDGAYVFDNGQFFHYTTNDGLGSNFAFSVFEDSNNIIWIGGEYFLCKFNGTGFINYSTTYMITSITEDFQGNLWCTSSNIVKFDGINFSDEYPGDFYDIACDNNGNIWCTSIGMTGGITRYDGIQWTHYNNSNFLNSNYINSVFVDNSGLVWFSGGRGIIRYDGNQFSFMSTGDGLIDNFVTGIHADDQNRIWFNSRVQFCSFLNGFWIPYYCDWIDPFGNMDSWGITEESNGNLWFVNAHSFFKYDPVTFYSYGQGVFNGGGYALSLCEYHPDTLMFGTTDGLVKAEGTDYSNPSTFTIYNEGTGLPSDCIFSQLKDHTDVLWLGTALGISYYDGISFYYFSHDENLGDSIYDIVEDTGYNLWFASNHGVGKYDGSSWTYYHEQDGLSDNEVHELLFDSKSRMWFATDSGLSMLDTTGWTVYHIADGLVYDRTLCLEEDNDGNIWVGTYFGVSELVFPEDTLGINPPVADNDKYIFDLLNNPTSGKFTIRTNRQPEVSIYNSTGNQILTRKTGNIGSKEFDLSGFPSGIYFVKGTYEEKIAIRKLLKM